MLRTARAWSQPPSIWLRAGDGNWTEQDRLLTVALTLHEAGLHSCGHPASLAFSQDAEGWFETAHEQCQACAAAELDHGDHGPRRPGEVRYVVNTAGPGEIAPWPAARPATEA